MTATIEEAARLYAAGDLGQAARVCLDIVRANPTHFDALHLLGVICVQRGQHADGVSYLLRADAARPNDAMLQANLGNAYGAVQRFDKAVESCQRAVVLGHRNAGVLNTLALARQGLGQSREALETFAEALELDPGNDPALFNFARAKASINQFAAAEVDFRLLLDRMPANTSADRIREVTNELARAVTDQGRVEEALAILREAIARRPDIVSFRWNEALVLLLLGRFAEGWSAYETRWDAPAHDRPHADYQILDLDQVFGQRVLIREEQGRGDIIQCLRYIPLLAARGARVTLSVYGDILPLASEVRGVERVLGPEDDVAEYDLLTSIMSLPLAFRTTIETIPAEVPYLRAPAARIGRMRHHLGPATGPRVGLAWSGSPASRARSALPVSALEPLLRRPGVEFHCLQKEVRPEDRAWLDRSHLVMTHETMLRDFGDTAALIEAMDMVISIDTAVAHLAGALAKPVWIMLAHNPDWRWLLGRADSPWYPTARLFRQTPAGDWAGVVRSVDAALTL